jgi:hypothetical protein
VRVSTADRGQIVENRLQHFQETARQLGWTTVPTAAEKLLAQV